MNKLEKYKMSPNLEDFIKVYIPSLAIATVGTTVVAANIDSYQSSRRYLKSLTDEDLGNVSISRVLRNDYELNPDGTYSHTITEKGRMDPLFIPGVMTGIFVEKLSRKFNDYFPKQDNHQ